MDEEAVFRKFSETVQEGNQEILVASPWVSEGGLTNIFQNLRPNAPISKILIKIKEKQDGNLNDLDKLNLLKLDGAQIRCCSSLDVKMLIVDNCKVLIGSEDISASGLGIDRAPYNECGVISDEANLIGMAKQKYDEIWKCGIDYELGDLRIVNNKLVYSERGNRKMTKLQLADLSGVD